MLEPTGERFLLSMDLQIALEHWHRYTSIAELVRDRDVADIASGEGYGSHYLAGVAKSVVGIDVAEQAVAHARERYVRSNLRYECGSMARIPLAAESVDVLVSFETFEHAGVDDQRDFLEEAKRVLRSDGFLVVSTPDRDVYSTMRNYSNAFHVHELTRAEFVGALSAAFPYVRVAQQKCAQLSLITSEPIAAHAIQSNSDGEFVPSETPFAYEYLIAVCARDESVQPVLRTSVSFDEQMLRSVHDRRLTMIAELETTSRALHERLAAEEAAHAIEQERTRASHAAELTDATQRMAECERELLSLRREYETLSSANATTVTELERTVRARDDLERLLVPKNYAKLLIDQLDFKSRKSLARLRRRAREAIRRGAP